MSEHAILAPSSADQWVHCSGSVMANASAPSRETEASRKGTATHWVVSEVLTAWKTPNASVQTCDAMVGKTAPNGYVVTPSMATGAQVMVDDVLQVCQIHGALQSMLVEHRVHMPSVHPENWGTLDCAIPLLDKGLIFIWDYKNGHRQHYAKDKYQLINYVAGLVNELKIDGDRDQQVTVVMRIVQPFCYKADGPVDEWVVKLSDLRAHFNKLHAAAHEALTAPTFTSGLHCRDCAAVHRCSTAKRYMYSLIDYVNEPYDIVSMNALELATERDVLTDGRAVLSARLDAIEDDLKYRVSQGDTTSGLVLQAAQGRLDWCVPVAQVTMFAKQFGVDVSKPAVLTPTQAKAAAPKEIRAGFEQALKSITHRPSGGLKLTNADDTIGARAFKKRK